MDFPDFKGVLKWGSKTRLYEGDITPKRHRNAIVCPFNWCFWPKSSNGLVVIPYVISSSYTREEKALIVGAIQEYETLTCIHFVDRTTETDYIYISPKDGCWSYFGKVGGSQVVSVQKGGCMRKGIIQHELNHALGMLHEQNRNDRDKYIVIAWQYISPGDFYHFKPTRANNLGLKYDYSSVMHYHRFAFSNTSGKATITPFPDSTVPIGQRFGISNLDVAKINKLYKCVQCGKTFIAMNGKFKSPLYPSHYPPLTDCAWIMIAPEGSKNIPVGKVRGSMNLWKFPVGAEKYKQFWRLYELKSQKKPQVLLNHQAEHARNIH
ncbi:hatching enzyme 1.2-like [Macrochelys suwanniensis]